MTDIRIIYKGTEILHYYNSARVLTSKEIRAIEREGRLGLPKDAQIKMEVRHV